MNNLADGQNLVEGDKVTYNEVFDEIKGKNNAQEARGGTGGEDGGKGFGGGKVKGEGGGNCFVCGEPGHMARDCPQGDGGKGGFSKGKGGFSGGSKGPCRQWKEGNCTY